jgi:hypothetical protein
MTNESHPQTYFHCAPIISAPGAVIEPGNWGRIIKLYEAIPGSGLPTNAFREALIEQARQIHAPSKPSRLSSIFALPTLEEAVLFRNKYQRTNLIYEVMPVAKNARTHLGDYEFAININYPPRYFQTMFDYARDYWLKQPTANLEVLFSCPIRVLRMLDVPPPDPLVMIPANIPTP